jgi:Flp pilus assembly protein TadD
MLGFLRRGAVGLLVAAAMLTLLEGTAALLGPAPVATSRDPWVGFAGASPLFVASRDADGSPILRTATAKAGLFNMQSFAADKPAGTRRVFCVGGSTTYGRPWDGRTSFCGWLERFLAGADPTQRWEVINAGGISYASYRVARVVDEIATCEPDLVIVYTGHNEFLERRTYGDVLRWPEWMRTLGALATRTHVFAVLDSLWRGGAGVAANAPSAAGHTGRELLPAEVQTVLDRSVGPTEYRREDFDRETVYAHFGDSLARMVRDAREGGARVLLVTPASNIAACSPFRSQYSADPATIAACEAALSAGRAALDGDDPATGLSWARRAVELDPRHADGHWLAARALRRLGRTDEARREFVAARDEDVCPLRAPSPIADIVRRTAAATGAMLVDFEALSFRWAADRLPGRDLFLDHVHPSIETHRRLALEILERLSSDAVIAIDARWNAADVERITEEVLAGLDDTDRARSLRNLAKVLGWAGRFQEAEDAARRALELDPTDAAAWYSAGVGAEQRGDLDQAERCYRKAVELAPSHVRALRNLAGIARGRGRLSEALEYLLAARAASPADTTLVQEQARVLDELGSSSQARTLLNAALSREPRNAGLHYDLGLVLAHLGDREAAEAAYRRVLALDPEHADAHNNFGILLARRGDMATAREHFRLAVALDPDNEAAAANLARASR